MAGCLVKTDGYKANSDTPGEVERVSYTSVKAFRHLIAAVTGMYASYSMELAVYCNPAKKGEGKVYEGFFRKSAQRKIWMTTTTPPHAEMLTKFGKENFGTDGTGRGWSWSRGGQAQ